VPSEWFYNKLWWAAAFIAIAGFFDILDGRLARILRYESSFGISYDSLCDLVSFGVAPGVLVYVWVLMGSGNLGLMALLLYVVCAALRLARFNVQSKTLEKFGFRGLPSPMGAGLMFSPVLVFSAFKIPPDGEVMWFYLAAAPFIGLLMVSDVPYWKQPRFKLSGPFNALVVASIIITAIITNPEIMLLAGLYLYCIVGLVIYVVRQLNRKSDSVEDLENKKLPEESL